MLMVYSVICEGCPVAGAIRQEVREWGGVASSPVGSSGFGTVLVAPQDGHQLLGEERVTVLLLLVLAGQHRPEVALVGVEAAGDGAAHAAGLDGLLAAPHGHAGNFERVGDDVSEFGGAGVAGQSFQTAEGVERGEDVVVGDDRPG